MDFSRRQERSITNADFEQFLTTITNSMQYLFPIFRDFQILIILINLFLLVIILNSARKRPYIKFNHFDHLLFLA